MASFTPNLDQCYQILGLNRSATEDEVKLAYRQLVKRYHPDHNPGDPQAAEQFIRIHQAYELLIAALEQEAATLTASAPTASEANQSASRTPAGDVRIYVRRPASGSTPLTTEQKQLKQRALEQIILLLKQNRWQQAARQAEEIGRRLPNDPEIGKAQAKAYHGWARALLARRRYEDARPYLQKALKADSTNRQLWEEIERDYVQIERGLRL
jgi:tetratricopeptide (TPR) repeat protein